MSTPNQERRRFSRIHFNAHTQLQQGEHQFAVELVDISLKGLLAQTDRGSELDTTQPVQVDIRLGEDAHIQMEAMVVHREGDQLGLQCSAIELDSITHLRRLVELNLGDAEAAERELSELSAPQ